MSEIKGNQDVLIKITMCLNKARCELDNINTDFTNEKLILAPDLIADIDTKISNAEDKVTKILQPYLNPTEYELGEVCEIKSSSSDTAYKAELVEIIDMILTWWKEHEYDSILVGDSEQNTFDEVPSFVIHAKNTKKCYSILSEI